MIYSAVLFEPKVIYIHSLLLRIALFLQKYEAMIPPAHRAHKIVTFAGFKAYHHFKCDQKFLSSLNKFSC